MATFISHSAGETERFAAQFGQNLPVGTVVGLSGDLGAGKTQFVKGLARGLGVIDRVHSPTFALVNIYRSGRLPLYHLDLYRLETPEQILSAGLDEFFTPDGISVVEWVERWPGPAPVHYRRVQIDVTGESERRIKYE